MIGPVAGVRPRIGATTGSPTEKTVRRYRKQYRFRVIRVCAGIAILARFFACPVAHADASWMDSIGSVLDETARWLNRVGQKSENILAPNYNLLSGLQVNDFTGLTVDSRSIEKTFPVSAKSVVSVKNRFGEIRVSSWDNPVVRVVANVTVGASTFDVASQVARAVDVRSASAEGQLDISTAEPDTRDLGRVQIAVDYDVTIPKDASVNCKNTWGDTGVKGVGGAVHIDSMYGHVELADIAGPVAVRAHGELPLNATGLRQGGQFELTGTLAEFRNVDGKLTINSSMAAVELRELGAAATVEVTNNSGGIALYVPGNAIPDITASALFGAIRSDIPMEQTPRGDLVYGRTANPNSHQHIQLYATFNDIVIHREGGPPASRDVPSLEGTQPFSDVVNKTVADSQGFDLVVDGAIGDIHIEGVDEAATHIKATKLVRLKTATNARAALEALGVKFTQSDHRIEIDTSVTGDMASLDCSAYRVDLEIQCPRTTVIRVTAKSGHTAISGVAGPVTVDQEEGAISVEHVKGQVTLKNAKGGIEVTDCAGPLEANASGGMLTTRSVFAKQTLTCDQGKTVVDTPHGALLVRGKGGDVRVMALEGIGGNYDIQVQGGSLSLALPETVDAQAHIETKGGLLRVNSHASLTGSMVMVKDTERFEGAFGKGQYVLTLKTDGGDVILD